MLKAISNLTEPDERLRDIVSLDRATGQTCALAIGDLHAMVEPLELSESVPQDVRLQFDTARHAFVYSWFCYDLATLAEAHAYGALENGLRLRALEAKRKPERPGMKGLLKLAVQEDWLPGAEFGHLVKILPLLRNHVQHGQPHLNPSGSLEMLRVCHDALTRLFLR
jgi:hypothetical protein